MRVLAKAKKAPFVFFCVFCFHVLNRWPKEEKKKLLATFKEASKTKLKDELVIFQTISTRAGVSAYIIGSLSEK